VDCETQGVALGWYTQALSAPGDVDLVVPWKDQFMNNFMNNFVSAPPRHL
jgi:hypothetical protein